LKKILIVQQVPHEGPGIIAPVIRDHGLEPVFARAWLGEAAPYAVPGGCGRFRAIIVLGGPMGVYEEQAHPFIRDELRLIRGALSLGTPVLGICLGAQLLARAAGAAVYPGPSKEIGWYTVRLARAAAADTLLAGLPPDLTVFQWHGDTFDVPPRAVNLASSEAFPNQLLRVGRNSYGVQFHLEVTEEMVREWIAVNAAELASLNGVIDPAGIIERTPRLIGALHCHGRAVASRFLRLASGA